MRSAVAGLAKQSPLATLTAEGLQVRLLFPWLDTLAESKIAQHSKLAPKRLAYTMP